jgi:capsular polysaccharide export protein
MDSRGTAEAAGRRRPLFVYNGGLLWDPRVRRILTLAGYDPRLGRPGPGDLIGVWGKSPTSPRGETVSALTGAAVLRVEDAFLRSIRPGRAAREPIVGLQLDPLGVHFDSSVPSSLERILATSPLDDAAILTRARDGIERLKALHLSKYNIHDLSEPAPEPGYVLVIDQTRGDAAVEHGAAGASTFREMLVFAQEEHPSARIVIRAHPETTLGHRPGYYNDGHAHGLVSLLTAPVSPWALLDGATAVYTVSSQLGFEAILAGHRPRVFGQPFYSGWGLTQDENPVARRERKLTRAQLFAAAMILAPTWYDPCRDRLCSFEEAVDHLEARLRAFRDDRMGYVAARMRLWKRPHLQRFFGSEAPVRFVADPARAARIAGSAGRPLLLWGADEAAHGNSGSGPRIVRIEDGFLRSRGLGAGLVPPLSLVTDDRGMYFDPRQPSRLEDLIARPVGAAQALRAERLVRSLASGGASKYNLQDAEVPILPEGRRILVVGQVEDDASVRLGGGLDRSNLSLLSRARRENPDAVLIYKPHPDVAAGLRSGAIAGDAVAANRVFLAGGAGPAKLIEAVDEVWTMTSTLGFEALLRGKKVVTTGIAFYSGWGLTTDLFPQPDRRRARPDLAALAHAALIAYPRYRDPVSGLPCPPEVIVERLNRNEIPSAGPVNRSLSKLQGLLASQAWLWRRKR